MLNITDTDLDGVAALKRITELVTDLDAIEGIEVRVSGNVIVYVHRPKVEPEPELNDRDA